MPTRSVALAVLLVCLGIALGLLSCGDSPTGPKPPRDLSPAERHLVGSFNTFGLNLFREIAKGEKGSNVFISPLSVSMALGMTLNGAAGQTEDAMKSTLEFGGLTLEEIDQCYHSLMELLVDLDPTVDFRIANSIWYRQGEHFEEEFLGACVDFFHAVVAALDFTSPDAATTINAWVESNTNGKIKRVIDDAIPGDVVMYLINAIYFKGTWTYQFDPSLTDDDFFNLPDGSQAPCKMMEQPAPEDELEYSYLANDLFQAVDLPYADGWFSMTILLPKPGTDTDGLISMLDDETWDAWMSEFEEAQGFIFLPRFELEYKKELSEVLSTMGMGVAFGPAADFSRMNGIGGIWIDKVLHKTFVKVNEEGTEAAGVTVVSMIDSVPDTFVLRLDRPFVFVIRERHSGTILFAGRVADPTG